MPVEYFSYVGSYDGGVKIRGRWVRVCELNRIDKTGWKRHAGPLTTAQKKKKKNASYSHE